MPGVLLYLGRQDRGSTTRLEIVILWYNIQLQNCQILPLAFTDVANSLLQYFR